ncbi:hypothetical protein FQR65_LT20490 [Abscondita terminalis]|nr:hypothetical protein FQR65_LT20490 [Abscondita terminalis]
MSSSVQKVVEKPAFSCNTFSREEHRACRVAGSAGDRASRAFAGLAQYEVARPGPPGQLPGTALDFFQGRDQRDLQGGLADRSGVLQRIGDTCAGKQLGAVTQHTKGCAPPMMPADREARWWRSARGPAIGAAGKSAAYAQCWGLIPRSAGQAARCRRSCRRRDSAAPVSLRLRWAARCAARPASRWLTSSASSRRPVHPDGGQGGAQHIPARRALLGSARMPGWRGRRAWAMRAARPVAQSQGGHGPDPRHGAAQRFLAGAASRSQPSDEID